MKIKELKKMLEHVPDEAEFSIMLFDNKYELEFIFPKRGLLLKSKNNELVFAINQMGTHFSGKWGLEYIGHVNTGNDNKLIYKEETK